MSAKITLYMYGCSLKEHFIILVLHNYNVADLQETDKTEWSELKQRPDF